MLRVTTQWGGFPGAPGYTNLYFGEGANAQSAANAAVAAVHAFWDSFKGSMPAGVTLTVLPDVAQINSNSGQASGIFAISPAPTVIAGAAAGPYAGGTGACITWVTAGFVNGRQVRGRTFVVPIPASLYGSDGTLADAMRDLLAASATALRDTPGVELLVWHRGGLLSASTVHPVVSSYVRDRAAILRSRRG